MSGGEAANKDRQDRHRDLEAVSPQQPNTPEDYGSQGLSDDTSSTQGDAQIETSPLASIEWDRNQAVQLWSSRAEQIFGWMFDEVKGKRWDELPLVYPDDMELVTAVAAELGEGLKEHNTCLNRNIRKDGRLIYCEWFNSIRRDDQGRVTTYVSLVHDVTARVLSEQRAQQIRNAIRLVVERTSRVTGNQFYDALVEHLALTLGVRCAMLAVVDDRNPYRVESLSYWADGALRENIRFDLSGTPCEAVLGGELCVCTRDAQCCFPDDEILRQQDTCSLLGAPLVDSNGSVFGILSVFHDAGLDDRLDTQEVVALFADRAAIEIERVKAEQARQSSENRLRIMTEQVPAALWATDMELRFTHLTGAAVQTVDVSPADLIGVLLPEFVGMGKGADTTIAAHENARRGTSGSFEIEWSNWTFQGYVEPLRDADGTIVGTIGVAQNISELKAVQASLVSSEDRFRRLIEHAPEAVVLLDTDTGHYLMVNPAAEKLYKLPAHELYRRGPIDLSPPTQPDGRPSAEAATEYIGQAIAGETPNFEWVHLNSEGREIPCEIRLLALQHEGKNLVRGSITDVSERKRADSSFKRLESELAHVARVSTMGELVGGLAHELNQPLYAIQNYGKACGNLVADDRDLDRELLRNWLSEITATAQSAGEILSRLRNFVTRKPIKKQFTSLQEVVDSALMLTRYEAQNNGVRIECVIPDSLPQVYVDPVQIQQVLINMLRNAFDATAEKAQGVPTVRIAADRVGERVTVRVADNGPGLPADSRFIFDAFASTKPQGLGLGLAISKTIVGAHGGQLTATNGASGDPNEDGLCGAEFCFTLATTR